MAEPDPAGSALAGQTLGEFFVRRLLGRGGMGEVYEADQTALQRRVALKVLREELVKDPSYLQRFQAEARTIARIQHPNIVHVITIGERDSIHYIAMEFVDGRNLRDHIARQGALEEKEVIAILKKTASALQRAHEEGVVHRDVKPENILITRKTQNRPSEVKVADFGLARRMEGDVSVTQSGMTMGTPLYMSPEQIRGEPVEPRSDIYSLGITAYHMLAGEAPYGGDSPMAVAVRHLAGNPTPLSEIRPDVSPELCRLVERMMIVRPEERIQTAAEVLKELSKIRPATTSATREMIELPSLASSTVPITQPTAKASVTQTISHRMLQIRDAVGDQRRLPWLAPLSLSLAVIVGAISAWMFRERDPFVAAAAGAAVPHHKQLKAPDPDDEPSDPEDHFNEANSQPSDLREAALWGVLEAHLKGADTVKATLNAAVELYKLYRDRDEEALTEEVVQWLSDPERVTEQLAHAKLLKGFMQARRGEYEKARKSFENALGGKSTEADEFDRHRLESLAEEFIGCLHRMGKAGGEPSNEKLLKDFWRRFTPSTPSRPPKGKG